MVVGLVVRWCPFSHHLTTTQPHHLRIFPVDTPGPDAILGDPDEPRKGGRTPGRRKPS